MELRVLKYFVAVVDQGSFTAAATVACIAQSALSRHIRNLESELGVILLRRLPRGVCLTPAGKALYHSATRILGESERVKVKLSGRPGQKPGRAVLGISPTLGRLVIPELVMRCARHSPQIHLAVREAFSPALMEHVALGQIDVAIVTSSEPNAKVALHPLVGEPFALVSARSQRRAPLITAAQLQQIPVLMTRVHRQLIEPQLRSLGAGLNIHSEIDSVDAICELVRSGAFSTLMPVSVFASNSHTHDAVTFSQIAGIPLGRTIAVATKRDATSAWEALALRDLVQEQMLELAQRGNFCLVGSSAPEPTARSRLLGLLDLAPTHAG